ncbi:acyl-CoA dehydrogenase family protein [Acidiferrimicrobium sp. IK]|uniref:acyl-CoA dehydrogenase family protein n=1 Tax=Acidiferrimicrobium sp. IK TaxID=2871700 RepID=UPI0021CAEAED|nr:acyl-CoA dehydrogenase family protein [Acidiferrimicrobium sp. IK]MCU4183453.1 acyl-CoA dehydrogenase family protein [Acidiferrimicrobium sp. IK]
MDLDFTDSDRTFRDEVRTWLAEHVPREGRPTQRAAMRAFDLEWQRTQWDGGWAGISWPEEYGGRGLSLTEQLIWYEEYGRYDLPDIDARFVGISHAGPTLMARASDEQKAYHLPRILKGEVVWCQGFSEPDAGSDLASLRTRGHVDGDEMVISGQKIWTSYADIADWQELLVRTDPDVPKHKGITWIICDMHSPGIEIRPLETMEGESDFCEVFYNDVRLPLANVVGEIDDGWGVAMSTLAFERGTAFTLSQVQLSRIVEDLIDEARDRSAPDGRPLIRDEELARRLATARAEVASLRAMTYAAISRSRRQGSPGPEGSMLKLFFSDAAQRVYRLAFDIVGQDGLEYRSRSSAGGWSGKYLYSFSQSIGGGTSEIQRNIIGERVLGLPRG